MMTKTNEPDGSILVIDDDPNNIKILELNLEELGYEILAASNGVSGWSLLETRKEDIQVILLDRMMPEMSGIEFMKKLKSDSTVSHIPVIMQTAASDKKDVTEGINAGVYYYLIKPYDAELLISIVQAALNDHNEYSALKQELKEHKRKLSLVKESYFEVQTLEDARYLATFLANYYPDSDSVIYGLSELLLNAVEHGNLGITYEEKTELNKASSWEEEVIRRQQLPEYKDKKVDVHFKREANQISLWIKDEGKGFEWQKYMNIDPARATDNHGRGIAMSNIISFDSIEYKGCGNEVLCTINLKD